ncbi:hypothetical protein AGLY_012264 [Aphis glycines]|uniref:Uncharacterized protein n=1 Tax=Aphis glycines TaxID=307491 RepID=A0A6G0T9Y3_APHGL|nr:hypothetical protein AGLY_012264 [Aphis glycines]
MPPTIQPPPAPRPRTNHLYAPSVKEITQPTTADAKSTKITSASNSARQFQNQIQQNTLFNNTANDSEIALQLSSFINEFKLILNPLIFLLTTVINKLMKDGHIALITETHYKTISKLYFPGSAVIISSKIQHHLISCKQLPIFQSTTIQITLNYISIKISSGYFPSSSPITSQKLNLFLQFLGQYFLVGSDFNFKHS